MRAPEHYLGPRYRTPGTTLISMRDVPVDGNTAATYRRCTEPRIRLAYRAWPASPPTGPTRNGSMQMSRTVLIVDDHEPFRERARALLQADGFEVVGDAADGETAVEAAHRLAPQVVLLDVRLPGIDACEVPERLSARSNPLVVVLISTRAASTYRHRLQESSAR